MKVEIFDPDGKNVEDTGMPGELVCTRPHPSLPLGFWGDDSGEKVRKAYFERYPGIPNRPFALCQHSLSCVQVYGITPTSSSKIRRRRD